MFKYKTNAQLKAMTEAEQDTYAQEKRDHEAGLTKAQIDAGLKVWMKSKEFTEGFREFVGVKEIKDLFVDKEQFAELQEKYNQLLENNGNADAKGTTLLKAIMPIFEEIKTCVKNNTKKEFIVKADTLRANVVGNANALDLAGIGQLAFPKLGMYDIFRKVPVPKDANGTIRYTDWDPDTIVRAAAAIAEGNTFPESTAKWIVRTTQLEKIGDTLPVSEEFYYDAAMFAAELYNFLITNVSIVVNNKLVTGSGASPEIKGLQVQVPNYVPAAAGIQDATLYDLLVKVKSKISSLYGSKYSPNVAIMNSDDIDRYKLAKDANGNYVMPPFVTKDGQMIDGMLIIEANQVTTNTMFVGDNRFGAIYEEPGIVIETGLSGTDFVEDMRHIKARRRLQLLIRVVDQTGWLEVTDIDAALTTIGTAI